VVNVLAGALVLAGLPVAAVLRLLAGAAVVAVVTVRLLAGGPLRAVRPVLRALLTPAAQD
jgi:hypothetical protein